MYSELLIRYITEYSYLGLYIIIGLSILALPTPDEFLMTFVGFLSFSGQLNPVLAIFAAASGSITGITVAYLLGRFFEAKVLVYLKKYAGGERLEKVLRWYQRHGGKVLMVGYFIPGVRHLSGYIAGLSHLAYRKFAVYAYLGAIVWTSCFILLGRSLGSRWNTILPIIHRYSVLLGVIAVVLFLGFYLLYKNHERWVEWLATEFLRLPGRYLSLGKRRLLITINGVAFIVLFIILITLIQDFVAHEVAEFDELVVSWLELASPPWVIDFMQRVNALGTHLVIISVFLVAVFVLRRITRRWAHVLPLILAWGGGTVVDQLFRYIFSGRSINILEIIVPFQVPNTGFLLAGLSFYAVLGYLIVRENSWQTQLFFLMGELLLLLLIGSSPILLRIHTPSAMVTALTVGSLWALVCVFLYEFHLYRNKAVPSK
ncbi:DedA family protein [Desulfosporosinus fructosivorans]